MSIEVNRLFEMLEWYSNEETQKRGIEEGKKIKHLSVFFQPIESYVVWENCAKIISQQSDERLEKYLLPMFEWIRDENWLGYDTIYDRLKSMPIELIKKDYLYSMRKAIKLEDDTWVYHLDSLIEDKEIHNELSKEEKEIIKQYVNKNELF